MTKYPEIKSKINKANKKHQTEKKPSTCCRKCLRKICKWLYRRLKRWIKKRITPRYEIGNVKETYNTIKHKIFSMASILPFQEKMYKPHNKKFSLSDLRNKDSVQLKRKYSLTESKTKVLKSMLSLHDKGKLFLSSLSSLSLSNLSKSPNKEQLNKILGKYENRKAKIKDLKKKFDIPESKGFVFEKMIQSNMRGEFSITTLPKKSKVVVEKVDKEQLNNFLNEYIRKIDKKEKKWDQFGKDKLKNVLEEYEKMEKRKGYVSNFDKNKKEELHRFVNNFVKEYENKQHSSGKHRSNIDREDLNKMLEEYVKTQKKPRKINVLDLDKINKEQIHKILNKYENKITMDEQKTEEQLYKLAEDFIEVQKNKGNNLFIDNITKYELKEILDKHLKNERKSGRAGKLKMNKMEKEELNNVLDKYMRDQNNYAKSKLQKIGSVMSDLKNNFSFITLVKK